MGSLVDSKRNNSKLQLLKALGITSNLENAFQCSWLSVINGGQVAGDILNENTKLVATYSWDEKHSAELSSEGYNVSKENNHSCSIKIDGEECSVNKRGLNIVVWSKSEEKVIDSVRFDTFDNVSFERKILP